MGEMSMTALRNSVFNTGGDQTQRILLAHCSLFFYDLPGGYAKETMERALAPTREITRISWRRSSLRVRGRMKRINPKRREN
jgi:hypothetical protein